ncbi:MAG TPA: hypothetical protein VL092_07030, partial [Chitinophagaceae bacterium]|nr:hypothetical protein [Chitinophagaceae bacterium]
MHLFSHKTFSLIVFCIVMAWNSPHTTAQVVISFSVNIFNDANGNVVKDGSEPGIGSIGTSRLYVYVVRTTTNLIVDSAHILPSGSSKAITLTPGPYRIELSLVRYAIGTNVSITPINRTLPAGWYHTGERMGTGSADTAADGRFAFSGAASNAWFGIQRGPTADAKSYSVSNTAFSNTPPAGFADISTPSDPWMVIPMNAADLSGYATGGSLSGSDPEDCTLASSCNTGTGSTFIIDSLYDDTRLFYNFGGATGVQEVDLSGGPFVITNFNVNNMVIWGREGAGGPGNELGFKYALRDAAGVSAVPATYTIATTVPLPVGLLYFTINKMEDCVVLNWATANEQNNKGFEIEHSLDARDWRSLGFVSSKSVAGNQTMSQEYTYRHYGPEQGRNLYRLKQWDIDG